MGHQSFERNERNRANKKHMDLVDAPTYAQEIGGKRTYDAYDALSSSFKKPEQLNESYLTQKNLR